MGSVILSTFPFKDEYFEVVVHDEFDATAGDEGWMELHLADRERYGLYRLFIFTLNSTKDRLTLWIREPLHGQLFTSQFIYRAFTEVCKCLEKEYDLFALMWVLGIEFHIEGTTEQEKDREILRKEKEVDVLF